MSRKTFGYAGTAVVLFIFIGALTGVIYQQSKDNTAKMNKEQMEDLSIPSEEVLNEGEPVSDALMPGEIEEVKQIISESHKNLNVAVGWQGYRSFSWDNRQQELITLLSNIKSLVEAISETSLEQDILNVIACIEKALDDQDVEGVILAHRIMHDLDYYINGNEADGRLYFVTHYGNDQNVEDLYSYIH